VANDIPYISVFQDFSGVATKKRHMDVDLKAVGVDFSGRKAKKLRYGHISDTWAVIQ
jgi:hypothetical protein